MPRARTSFADFSINPTADRQSRKAPTHLPTLDVPIDPLERKVRDLIGIEMGLGVDEVLLEAALA